MQQNGLFTEKVGFTPNTHLLDVVCFGIPIYSGAAYALPLLPSSAHSPVTRFSLSTLNAGSPDSSPGKFLKYQTPVGAF